MQEHYIFVYGSLLKNYSNHHILGQSKFLAFATIRAKLYTSHFSFPFILLSNNNLDKVYGEIYRVNDDVLSRLDILEGYSKNRKDNFYFRKKVLATVINHDNSVSKVPLFTYVGSESHAKSGSVYYHITTGNWKDVKSASHLVISDQSKYCKAILPNLKAV